MTPALTDEMLALLARNGPDWAEVVAAYRRGLRVRREIVATGVGGDSRNVDRILLRIRFVLAEESASTGPARAEKVAASVRALLNRPGVSPTGRDHLRSVLNRLGEVAGAAEGRERRSVLPRPTSGGGGRRQAEADSDERERELRSASGVYVFTYPRYLQAASTDAGRLLLKVGRTTQPAWKRVLDQARSTGAPEDPVLLRVYVTEDPDIAERKFHRMLDAAEHTRQSTRTGGQEWFATTLEFLDEIASTLGLQARKGTLPGLS